VNRGGSWNNTARNVRSAYRNNNWPDNRNNWLGFRPVSTGEPGSIRRRYGDPNRPGSCPGAVSGILPAALLATLPPGGIEQRRVSGIGRRVFGCHSTEGRFEDAGYAWNAE
jgi:hypothetical protein